MFGGGGGWGGGGGGGAFGALPPPPPPPPPPLSTETAEFRFMVVFFSVMHVPLFILYILYTMNGSDIIVDCDAF